MRNEQGETFPQSASTDELIAYFDTHDLGDVLEDLPEVEFEVALQRRPHLFVLDADLIEPLDAIAARQQIPSESLINSWLREKLSELQTV